jgi:hypothetical protein
MTDDKKMLDSMEFEQHLQEMGDDQLALLKFVARQQYTMSQLCPLHDRRLRKLENRTKKELGTTSGISAFLGVVIGAAIDYLMRR